MQLHTMRLIPNRGGWSVGYWRVEYNYGCPSTYWETVCEFSEEADALNRVNQLNGGQGVMSTALIKELQLLMDKK